MQMKSLEIKGTKKTPGVEFIPDKGIMNITGNSIPEDPTSFYQPIDDLLEEYVQNAHDTTVVNIKLYYFNTGTSKWLLYLFLKFKEINDNGKHVDINWYYEDEDEDCKEAGESYKSILKLPFHLVKYQPEEFVKINQQ